MNARLVYIVDGVEIQLEEMEIESLDQLTYSSFDNEEDIINSARYIDKLENLSKNGEVKVAFNAMDMPISAIDYFAEFGFEPFSTDNQYMCVLVNERKIGPTIRGLRENIVRTLCDVKVVEEFYERFKEKYTPYERLFYLLGMEGKDDKLVFEGIKRIIGEATGQNEGYFVGRVFIEGLSKFETVKNKDDKGRLISPKVFEKK